ncbi:hypothetical protein Hanom_Chr12g01104621 [Helianthus anomalus]
MNKTAAASFYCCEPSSTCHDQQCLTQGSSLGSRAFSLQSVFVLNSSCRSADVDKGSTLKYIRCWSHSQGESL